MFRQYIHHRQCDGYENKFYSAQITMHTLHYVAWIQRYNGTRMHVNLTKMTVSQGAYKERLKLMCLTC